VSWKVPIKRSVIVVVLFLLLFAISASVVQFPADVNTMIPSSLGLFFIPGNALTQCSIKHQLSYGYRCPNAGDYPCGGALGTGFPFMWRKITLLWYAKSDDNNCSGQPAGGFPTAYWEDISFDPVNFILDVIVWLVVALLPVVAYDKLKEKTTKKTKKPK